MNCSEVFDFLVTSATVIHLAIVGSSGDILALVMSTEPVFLQNKAFQRRCGQMAKSRNEASVSPLVADDN